MDSSKPRPTPQEPEHLITCETCKKEVPASVAHVNEGQDYILHFCGIDCLYEWEDKQEKERLGGR